MVNRIVVSGTYGTGKTTLTHELEQRIRMPSAVARGMRELLPIIVPGKSLEECDGMELLRLGWWRFQERVSQEARLQGSGFISDGSAIHEWAYGNARIDESTDGIKKTLQDESYINGMKIFGDTVARYADTAYDIIFHLPIEFPIPQDGHRPVSENFREVANSRLLETWEKLGKKVVFLTGNIEQRVEKVVSEIGFTVSQTLDGAVSLSDGVLWAQEIDDILGDGRARFFTSGFRNNEHRVYNILLNQKEGRAECDLDVTYAGNFSKKDGKNCTPHLSSLDIIRVAGQLSQAYFYTLDGVKRGDTGNYTLRGLSLKTGNKLEENLTKIECKMIVNETKILSARGKNFRIASFTVTLGKGFELTANIAYELPQS